MLGKFLEKDLKSKKAFDKIEIYAIIKIEIRSHKSGRRCKGINAHSIRKQSVHCLFLFAYNYHDSNN